MKLEVKTNCPLNNFEPCRQFDCNWFMQIRGTHPQTGEEQDVWSCAMAVLPLLLIENSKEVRQGAAATESFRNEMVKDNAEVKDIMRADLQLKLDQHNNDVKEREIRQLLASSGRVINNQISHQS